MSQLLHTNYLTILRVAMPLMIGNFIQSLVLITDVAFLARLDTVSYDAAGNAGLLYVTCYMIAAGFGDGLQITNARLIGQNKDGEIRRYFQSGFFVLVMLAVLFFTLIQLGAPNFLRWFAFDKEIAEAQISFLSIRSYSLFFSLSSVAMMSILLATGKTQIVFVSSLLMSAVNIVLDYGLIFGELGLPRMGMEGAALASVIAEITVFIFFISYFLLRNWIKEFRLTEKVEISRVAIGNLVHTGWPLMLQGLITLGTWTVFFSFIEQLGRHKLEISQNIRSMYFLAFVPIFGFAATTKTYISQLIGAGKFDEIRFVQRKIQLLVTVTLVLFFHGALLYPVELISLINPNPQAVEESAQIIQLVAPAIFIFGLTSVYFNTVAGSGNTKASLTIEAISTGIYLICAYLFIYEFEYSLAGIWSVEYIYFSVLGILSLGYLYLFNWKKTGHIV
jgi:multidrug resistance protein, MATE family